MICIARAPVRLTLGGGGTDYPFHYKRFGGHVIALAVRRYVAVSIATRFGASGVEVRARTCERASSIAGITNDLVRATLIEAEVTDGVQVAIAADIPAGTGVGSSSALVVALLAASYALTGKKMSPGDIAEKACTIEMERLRRDVGKQDQYMSALGGMQSLILERDGTVAARDISPDGQLSRSLASRVRIYWNGQARNGHEVRMNQMRSLAGDDERRERHDALVREIAEVGRLSLAALEAGELDAWGAALHEHWCLKRAVGVENSCFPDELYDRLRAEACVAGGKLMGAGGNGVVLLYCTDDGASADELMTGEGFTRIDFSPASRGVEVIVGDDAGGEW